MIISYRWLKEMIDLPVSPEELVEVLTFLGLEVEKTTKYRASLDKVVIGDSKPVYCVEVDSPCAKDQAITLSLGEFIGK